MSMVAVDILIWALLFAGIGFGLLSFFGLLIFPDIRSRRFTTTRALLISTGLLTGATVVFAMFRYGSGNEYTGLFVRALFLWALLAITIHIISRRILRQIARKEAEQHKNG